MLPLLPGMKDHSFGVIPIHQQDGKTRYLLIQHRAGHWAFPKGHAEPGESDTQAALRELREETGICNITLYSDPAIVETYQFARGSQTVRKTVRYFIGLVGDSTVRLQEAEVSAYRWADYEEARALITYEESRRSLETARQIFDALQARNSGSTAQSNKRT